QFKNNYPGRHVARENSPPWHLLVWLKLCGPDNVARDTTDLSLGNMANVVVAMGLKQGDPLSPFLFILIMESLHLSFQRVVDARMFKGITLSSSLMLSHMFYADDVIFVGQWCDDNINTLVQVLECFFHASGLHINMNKSKLMGILVDDEKVKQAASKLGCLILKPPFSYLCIEFKLGMR
ncbi:RNA-directed DNA polymerase, eukaryota, reverse transcriptase zinc-binding domain protein, partial [Tanacetum coccineum]